MSTQMPFDPFTMWKTIYDQTEATWNKTIQEAMNKDSFSESMGETLNYYLQYQELVNKMTESYLKELNMPSRSEISDIASLVINLEEKVDQFNEDMEDELAKTSTSNEIRSLRRAVTNLDKKLSTVLKEVELMNKNIQPAEKKETTTKKKKS